MRLSKVVSRVASWGPRLRSWLAGESIGTSPAAKPRRCQLQVEDLEGRALMASGLASTLSQSNLLQPHQQQSRYVTPSSLLGQNQNTSDRNAVRSGVIGPYAAMRSVVGPLQRENMNPLPGPGPYAARRSIIDPNDSVRSVIGPNDAVRSVIGPADRGGPHPERALTRAPGYGYRSIVDPPYAVQSIHGPSDAVRSAIAPDLSVRSIVEPPC